LTRRVFFNALLIAGLLISISCSPPAPDKSKKSKKKTNPKNPVTCISVIGCSGQPVLKLVLKKIAKKRYVASIEDSQDRKIKLAGHLLYCDKNIEILKQHNFKAVLICRDPRSTLVQLVHRSLYDWCPSKFEKPRIHPSALAFHQIIKESAGKRGDQGFVEFYLGTLDTKQLLLDIFQVAKWHSQSGVHFVKYEDLTDFSGNDRDAQLRAIQEIGEFLGVSVPDSVTGEITEWCKRHLKEKKSQKNFMIDWKELFTEKDKALFKKYFGQLVIDLGYEKDNDW